MSHHAPDLEAQAQTPIRTFSEASTVPAEVTVTNLQSTSQSSWIVVIQSPDDNCILLHIPVNEAENGEQFWSRIRGHLTSTSTSAWIWSCLLACFTKTIVGTATFTQMFHLVHNVALQVNHYQVSIQNFQQDWLLTKAFRLPTTVTQNADYASQNQRFIVTPDLKKEDVDRQDVLVVRTIIDKTKVAWLLIILLILSPGLGLVIGLCTHNAQVGIAVSAGVYALAAFLQGLAAWFHS